ncbi:Hypothetical protein LUCI_1542 [Lucifera butyrica]|uniref:Uncharacterized protein n=1 Tax=Lucifera butyrica TaxID=1351585 RepID=A0A498R7S1_9FIRM|nr:hypothetical protein [Lucifera butyrica]VBB06312.1 Hypothetical protein LUCI_1542 [Lucifera butyrica]
MKNSKWGESSQEDRTGARTEVKYYDREGKLTIRQKAVRRICIKYDEQGNYIEGNFTFNPKGFSEEENN